MPKKPRSAAAREKAAAEAVVASAAEATSPDLLGRRRLPRTFFDFDEFGLSSASKFARASSPLLKPVASTPPSKPVSSISDLRDLTSSRLGSFKRQLDLSHSDILKEMGASKSRISKRFKVQSQETLKQTDDAERDYQKMLDRVRENIEIMNGSYAEFIAEAQASASRVCKVTIPELAECLSKSIEALRSRYGIASST